MATDQKVLGTGSNGAAAAPPPAVGRGRGGLDSSVAQDCRGLVLLLHSHLQAAGKGWWVDRCTTGALAHNDQCCCACTQSTELVLATACNCRRLACENTLLSCMGCHASGTVLALQQQQLC